MRRSITSSHHCPTVIVLAAASDAVRRCGHKGWIDARSGRSAAQLVDRRRAGTSAVRFRIRTPGRLLVLRRLGFLRQGFAPGLGARGSPVGAMVVPGLGALLCGRRCISGGSCLLCERGAHSEAQEACKGDGANRHDFFPLRECASGLLKAAPTQPVQNNVGTRTLSHVDKGQTQGWALFQGAACT